jgi:hypothetical protein
VVNDDLGLYNDTVLDTLRFPLPMALAVTLWIKPDADMKATQTGPRYVDPTRVCTRGADVSTVTKSRVQPTRY